MRDTSAAAAPFASAVATKSWPSRASFSATKRSPGAIVRLSIETPVAAKAPSPSRPSRARLGRGPERRHATARRARRPRRSPARRRRRDRPWRRRSGRSRGPCPCDQKRVAGAERVDAPQDRLGPVADLVRLGAARRISPRGCGGVLGRGLSSVTKPRRHSGRRAPHQRALPRSRSPPAPKTTTSRPMTCGRSAAAPWPARRACGHSRRRP
jgi:hypothetical protein